MAEEADEEDAYQEQLAQAIALSLSSQPTPNERQPARPESGRPPADLVDLSTESEEDPIVKTVTRGSKRAEPLSSDDEAEEYDGPRRSSAADIRTPRNKAGGFFSSRPRPVGPSQVLQNMNRKQTRKERPAGPSPVRPSQMSQRFDELFEEEGPVPPRAAEPSRTLQSMDRKQMEAERLARLKREAPSISPPPSRRAVPARRNRPAEDAQKIDLLSSDEDVVTFKPRTLSSRTNTAPSARPISSAAGTTPSLPVPSTRPGIQYPDGVVRKTWAYQYPRGDDIKIEEVLQKDDLNVAVLSAFQWDMDWLFSKLDLNSTKIVFIMQAKDEATKTQYRMETQSMPNIRLCFPSMAGNVNCMHSKLQLLFHKEYLRVVVPSANLLDFDWGERGGIMENIVFLVDLPRLPSDAPEQSGGDLTFFGQELLYFMKAMGLQSDIRQGVLKFDFSKTKDMAFVHTIGGSHYEQRWRRTGYCGLGRAVRTLGLHTEDPIDVDFVASSMGSLTNQFIKTIYLAAQGDDGMTEFLWRNPSQPKPRRSKTSLTQAVDPKEAELQRQIDANFRVYFPTQDTVIHSRGGSRNGGTICLQSRWFDSPKFPSRLFRDCKSRRPGMLMHNKMIFVRPKPSPSAANPPHRAWAYVGSANLSESAWGRLVGEAASKSPKLNCRNWECGVVLPLPATPSTASSMDAFAGRVPVPMEVPGAAYGAKRPWIQSERVVE